MSGPFLFFRLDVRSASIRADVTRSGSSKEGRKEKETKKERNELFIEERLSDVIVIALEHPINDDLFGLSSFFFGRGDERTRPPHSTLIWSRGDTCARVRCLAHCTRTGGRAPLLLKRRKEEEKNNDGISKRAGRRRETVFTFTHSHKAGSSFIIIALSYAKNEKGKRSCYGYRLNKTCDVRKGKRRRMCQCFFILFNNNSRSRTRMRAAQTG